MIEYGIGYVEARGLSTGKLSDAQRTLYFIAENMKKQQSISKDGYEHFQQAIEALGYQNMIDQTSAVLESLLKEVESMDLHQRRESVWDSDEISASEARSRCATLIKREIKKHTS